MPKKKIDKIYDKTFKKWISEKSEAIALSKLFLPPDISDNLAYETMKIENASFVDDDYDESSSDLVYSCEWKTGEGILIDFIYEHKSYLPQHPEFQLMRYLYNGYNYQIKQGKQPTPIISILLYHGKEQWQKREISDYFKLQETTIKPYIPNFDYVLIDLADYTDEEIMEIEVGFLLRSIMLLFKHKDDHEFVLQNSEKLFIFVEQDIAQERVESYFEMIFIYVIEAFSFKKGEVKKIMDAIPNNLKNKAMSTYDMLIQEGVVIGEEKGLKTGLERGRQFTKTHNELKMVLNLLIAVPDWSDEKIALVAETTVKFVKEVKAGFVGGNRKKAEKVVRKTFKELGKLYDEEEKMVADIFKEYLKKFK